MPGSVISEGDRAMRSDIARFRHHLDGEGINIGIISDSFNAFGELRDDVLAGELPGRRNPNGYTTPVKILQDESEVFSSDEGRALGQIIHDVAPGARLLFYSPSSVLDFAKGIDSLVDAGADVIVDDLFFFRQPFFQDGPVTQAVNRAVEKGVTFVSAAGNAGRASYESPLRLSDKTFLFEGIRYDAHDFAPDSAPDAPPDFFQAIEIPAGDGGFFSFGWSEPYRSFELGSGATSDLDIFIMKRPRFPTSVDDKALVTLSFRGNQGKDPLELVRIVNDSARDKTYYLVVGKLQDDGDSPSPELIKWVDFAGPGLTYEYVNDVPKQGRNPTIYGHPNAEGAIAVAAVRFDQTPAFGQDEIIPRNFTSVGRTPILFDTEGNLLDTPIIRAKPELAAPDGVSTSVPFFERFAGTSAAAPHVAAVVALMLQRAGGRKSLAPEQLRDILQRSVLETGLPGFDPKTGTGFLQADLAVLDAVPTVTLEIGQQQLRGTVAAENLVGRGTDDQLFGGGGDDALMGEAGDDQLKGNQGRDWLQGKAGQDLLWGNGDDDTLDGGPGRDRLWGGSGNDTLVGDLGNDQLVGGPGDDLLIGGLGRNELEGNRGNDDFVLDPSAGVVIIKDFQVGRDRLALVGDLTFDDLILKPRKNGTLIQRLNEPLNDAQGSNSPQIATQHLIRVAQLRGIQPEQLTVDDAVEIALPI